MGVKYHGENMDELDEIRKKKMEELAKKYSEEQKEKVIDKPIIVTDETFSKVVQKHKLVVVDCWAAWCGPCRMIGPIIEQLARDYAGKIVFGKLNVDENRQIPMKYQIMSIPTLLIFKDGNLVDKIIGAMSRQYLEPRITQHF